MPLASGSGAGSGSGSGSGAGAGAGAGVGSGAGSLLHPKNNPALETTTTSARITARILIVFNVFSSGLSFYHAHFLDLLD